MRLVFTENVHGLELPPGHKFPLGKYDQIHRALAASYPDLLQLGPPAPWEDVTLVHSATYASRVRNGTLDPGEIRRLGLPWSPSLVDRAMRSVGGTLAALAWAVQEGAAGHIAGGTHHAFSDRGEGFCVFNDIAIACRAAARDHGFSRPAIVDLDVHQGNGTAAIFAGAPEVFTLSIHAGRNYPFRKEASSLDVALPDGTTDDDYLRALDSALGAVESHAPDILFYQAGVDVLSGDRLGRMGLTHLGIARRDAMVYRLARDRNVPLVVTLGGGYARTIERSVEAHVAVYRGLVDAFA